MPDIYQRRWVPRLASAGLYAVSCFIVSVVVVAGFALVVRRPASNTLELVAYPFGVSLYFALPVVLVAFVISIFVLDPLNKRGTSAIIRAVLAGVTGAAAATFVALVVSLLQGNYVNVVWILIVVPWTGAFFGGGVLLELLRKHAPTLKFVLPAVAVVFALLGAVTIALATGF